MHVSAPQEECNQYVLIEIKIKNGKGVNVSDKQ